MKKTFYKKADPINAILRVCDPKYFVLRKDRLPAELIDFTIQKAHRFKRGLYFRECKDFHDFTYNYDQKVNLRQIEEVRTELVVMRWKTIKEFYGVKVVNGRHYGIKNYVNRKRIADLHALPVTRVESIIDVASAGMWSIINHEKFGFAIHQKTTLLNDPINVLTHNQWIMHNVGLISKLNSMYYQE